MESAPRRPQQKGPGCCCCCLNCLCNSVFTVIMSLVCAALLAVPILLYVRRKYEALANRPGGVPGGPACYANYVFTEGTTTGDVEMDHEWIQFPPLPEAFGEVEVGGRTASLFVGNGIFASFQFQFESGAGGYMGTQVWRRGEVDVFGAKIDAGEEHRVIFSTWDLDALNKVAPGEGCSRLVGGEGFGAHCLASYPLREGRKYSLRFRRTGNNGTGDFWSGSVLDRSSGVRTTVGSLYFPDAWGKRGYGLMKVQGHSFLEYFHTTGCDGQAPASVGLWGPFFNNRSVAPAQAISTFHNCSWSDVSDCIPEHGCGNPRVLFTAGGTTQRTAVEGGNLW